MKNELLGSLVNGRKNNLDALRIIAAFLVLFSHSFALDGLNNPNPPFYQRTFGEMGVDIFFVISGFLITQSFINSNSQFKFILSRVLRIFPALIVVVFVSAFILGPLVTNLAIGEYFKSSEVFHYLSNITLYDINFTLPGVFPNNPNTAVNGSLWTLEYEFTCYILVLLLGIIGLLKDRRISLGIFLVSLVLLYFNFHTPDHIYKFYSVDFLRFFVYFNAGMVAYQYRDKIQLRGDILFMIVLLLMIGGHFGGFNDLMFVCMISYLVLFIGFYPRLNISGLTKYGDFSYGIYIWAFPVQQTIVFLSKGKMEPLLIFLISGIITYTCGYLSWHLIEKRMLKLKNRFNKIQVKKTTEEVQLTQ